MANGFKSYFFFRIQEEEVVPLEDGMIFGRKKNIDYVLDDTQISGKHFRITIRSRKVYLKDLGSTNLTFLNGDSVTAKESTLLTHGDAVRAGSVKFIFLYDDVHNFTIPEYGKKGKEELTLDLNSRLMSLKDNSYHSQSVGVGIVNFDKSVGEASLNIPPVNNISKKVPVKMQEKIEAKEDEPLERTDISRILACEIELDKFDSLEFKVKSLQTQIKKFHDELVLCEEEIKQLKIMSLKNAS